MVFKSRYADVIPDKKYADLVSNFFWHQLDKFEARELFVDYETRRQWTGAQIKTTSARLASQLIRHGLKPNDDCVAFYKHCDYIQVAALGILFAGGSLCAGYDLDPEQEHAYMLEVMRPSFVFVARQLGQEMVRLRSAGQHNYKIVIMDDDSEDGSKQLKSLKSCSSNQAIVLGLHTDLLTGNATESTVSNASRLPVQVDPQRPAFVLLTSGSTGRPKPVCRSQRNSLYVCHSLMGAQDLWDLNESSVVAAHLALDHGTGIFLLKHCLATGYKSIIINGYTIGTMLDAIQTHGITDLVLGSAYVHNLLSSSEVSGKLAHERLGSLRNLLAVGSSIASQELVRQFMSRLPECSVRQAMGMTECGFAFVVPRQLALTNHELPTEIVGCPMPNVEFKLVTRPKGGGGAQRNGTSNGQHGKASAAATCEDAVEITEFDQQGELYVRGPTVSPGYLGAKFRDQSRASFLDDGFYKTNDVCSFGSDGMLRMFGRFSDVLCLSDGWKVLPSEIEHTIMEHPFVKEAAVVGIPHPALPTCHAPRAYIVPRDDIELDDGDGDLDFQRNGRANGTNGSTNHSNNNNNNNSSHENNGHSGPKKATGPRKRLNKTLIFNFVAERLSEPKHLIGGIKFMNELPKISIGKVDKRALKQADGY